MSIFISGSLAYDYIMDVPDRFQRHILPDQLHILSVSFGVETLHRGWGGTAGNIAYAMRLLDTDPIVASALGSDGRDYLDHLDGLGIQTNHVVQDTTCMTASAHIITDIAENQITAFFPGPLARAGEISFMQLDRPVSLALVAPNPKEVMQKHLREAYEAGVKTVFDPGQQITAFQRDELRACLDQSNFFIGNDYEVKLLSERTGWSEDEIVARVDVLIKTLGEQGSVIRQKEQTFTINPCPVRACIDPTGAGDAFRAGFFTAYERGLDWPSCGRMGSVAAAYAVETRGTQEYHFTPQEFAARHGAEYGVAMTNK
jgi:adenosine kinase